MEQIPAAFVHLWNYEDDKQERRGNNLWVSDHSKNNDIDQLVVVVFLNLVFPNKVILRYSLDLNLNKSKIKIAQYNFMLKEYKRNLNKKKGNTKHELANNSHISGPKLSPKFSQL
jgi:hypothetical protein